MPVLLQYLLHIRVFGVHHQAAGVAVEPVHHVSRAFELPFLEIFVQDGLNAELGRVHAHAEDAGCLLHYHQILVFIDYPHILVDEFGRSLVACHHDRHARLKRVVVASDRLLVHCYGAPR